MSIQTEKLRLIEWLIKVQDQKILEALIAFRKKTEVDNYESNLKPMSIEELASRIEASNRDIEEGRVHDIESIVEEDWDNL